MSDLDFRPFFILVDFTVLYLILTTGFLYVFDSSCYKYEIYNHSSEMEYPDRQHNFISLPNFVGGDIMM